MCRDPSVVWYPQRSIDYAAMHQAAAAWRYDEAHKQLAYHDGTFKHWDSQRSEEFPFHYKDGVRVWVSREDLTPEDHFLTHPDLLPMDDDLEEGEDGDEA